MEGSTALPVTGFRYSRASAEPSCTVYRTMDLRAASSPGGGYPSLSTHTRKALPSALIALTAIHWRLRSAGLTVSVNARTTEPGKPESRW
jgi:hypothetical protein